MLIRCSSEMNRVDHHGFLKHGLFKAYSFARESLGDEPLSNMNEAEACCDFLDFSRFNKCYSSYQQEVNTIQTIKFYSDGFDWDIERTDSIAFDKFTECRYGISIQIDDVPVLYNSKPCPPIVNYTQEWLHPWTDQLNIPLPIVQTFVGDNPVFE